MELLWILWAYGLISLNRQPEEPLTSNAQYDWSEWL